MTPSRSTASRAPSRSGGAGRSASESRNDNILVGAGAEELRAAVGELEPEAVEEAELESDLEEISDDDEVELPVDATPVPEEEDDSEW
jgi:hypothetical protein